MSDDYIPWWVPADHPVRRGMEAAPEPIYDDHPDVEVEESDRSKAIAAISDVEVEESDPAAKWRKNRRRMRQM